jgi:hypothetical protein
LLIAATEDMDGAPSQSVTPYDRRGGIAEINAMH